MSDFHRAMKFVARWEGGFVDDPADPGGRTNLGITQRTLDAYREGKDLPKYDVKDLDKAEANDIYEDRYWNAAGCPALRWPLCLVHFDTAVNLGVSRANKMLVASGKDPHAYLHNRRNYYTSLANQKPALAKFLKGWLNRLAALGKEAGV
jgi:lysozyme family protein